MENLWLGQKLALGMLRSIGSITQAWLVPSFCPLSTAMHCCDRVLSMGVGLSPAHHPRGMRWFSG